MGSTSHRIASQPPRRSLELSARRRPAVETRQSPGVTARKGALKALNRVLQDGAMLDESGFDGTGAERAEARSLADLTLRRLGQIDAVLSAFLDRTPGGSGQQILRLMTAELLFAGTAAHAAVDTAIRVAQTEKRTSRLSGLINAVGRKISAGGDTLLAGQDAARLNMPSWLHRTVSQDWGDEAARSVAEAHLVTAPHDLTVTNPADLPPMAEEVEGDLLPTGSFRLSGRPQISSLPGYKTGAWWVQDAAAALPARLIHDPSGKRVLDLCAAPGGKTLQLAAAGAEVTALDISKRRMARLSENLDRTGCSAEVVVADAFAWEPAQQFDAVLLDAPCTATGTIRRHPELPYRLRQAQIRELTALQRALAERAAKWVAPGGSLVFCTCSILKAEGEDHLHFLHALPCFQLDPILPKEVPSEFLHRDGTLRTLPGMWETLGSLDGFFAARFKRGE